MKTKDIIEGLAILERYRTKPDGFNTGAEHDQIYAYQTDKPIETGDLAKLVALGWFQEDATYKDKFKVKNYDPEEGWTCYV